VRLDGLAAEGLRAGQARALPLLLLWRSPGAAPAQSAPLHQVPKVLVLAVIPDLSLVRGGVHGALVCVRGDVSLVEFCRFQDPLGTTSDWDPSLRQGLTWLHRAVNNSRAL
ncbi:Calcium-transporting ATPase, partial [Giardia duodenalis]